MFLTIKFRQKLDIIAGSLVSVLLLIDPALAENAQNSEESLQRIEQTRQKTDQELKNLKTESQQSAELLEKLENQITILKRDAEEIRQSLAQTSEHKAKLDAQIDRSAAKLSQLEKDKAKIQHSLRERNSVLAEILAALQRLGSNPPPALLVKPEDALSSVRSAILLGAVVPEIRAETQQLMKDLTELASIQNQISDERSGLIMALDKTLIEEEKFGQLLQEKAALNVASLQQLERERQKARNLAEKSEGLSDMLASLDFEINSIRATAVAAKEAELERQKIASERLASARKLVQKKQDDLAKLSPFYAFSALKNTLQFPVKGELAAHFGAKNAGNRILDGIVLASQSSAEVTSPIDGWIAYSGPFRSYGNLIIIDAGEGYHLILAGMDHLNVTQGQFVVAGEPIAQMGSITTNTNNKNTLTLASSKPSLYIELRKNKKIIDSTPWWGGIESGKASNDS